MTEIEILRRLVTDRAAAVKDVPVAAGLILSRRFFKDEARRKIALALLLNETWTDAVKWLRRRREVDSARLRKFELWAEKISRRPVRGLLAEKNSQ